MSLFMLVWISGFWYAQIQFVFPVLPKNWSIPLLVTPALCVAALYPILKHWAAAEVRSSPAFFVMGGALIIVFGVAALPLLGLSIRLDVVERRNKAVILVVCAAMIAVTICYAASNIGEGPDVSMTLVPAAVAIGTLFLLWLIAEALARFADAITIDRDLSSGIHLGAFLISAAFLLARGAAGDFVSWDATFHDQLEWTKPTLLLLAVAVVVQYLTRPSLAKRNLFLHGVIPALLQLSVASVFFFGFK